MDRVVRLSIVPVCVAVIAGLFIIWPDRRPVGNGDQQIVPSVDTEFETPTITGAAGSFPLPAQSDVPNGEIASHRQSTQTQVQTQLHPGASNGIPGSASDVSPSVNRTEPNTTAVGQQGLPLRTDDRSMQFAPPQQHGNESIDDTQNVESQLDTSSNRASLNHSEQVELSPHDHSLMNGSSPLNTSDQSGNGHRNGHRSGHEVSGFGGADLQNQHHRPQDARDPAINPPGGRMGQADITQSQLNPHSESNQGVRSPGTQRPLETPLNPSAHLSQGEPQGNNGESMIYNEHRRDQRLVEDFPLHPSTSGTPAQTASHGFDRSPNPNQPSRGGPTQQANQQHVPLPEHVVSRLREQIERSATLARKGALFSAKNEFVQSLYLIAEARDSLYGTRDATDNLHRALTALRESDEFARDAQSDAYTIDVERVVLRHQTPILDNEVGRSVSALEAMRRYYEYAGIHFIAAFGNEVIASETLHALGKLHIMPGGLNERGEDFAVPKAVVFFQSAVLIDPSNGRSANELGVQLARLGEWGGAKRALLHSLSVAPTPNAWRNLAVVHEHLNELDLANLANHEASLLEQQQQGRQPANVASAAGQVQFVAPDQFQATQPMGPPVGVGPVEPLVSPSAPEPETRDAARTSIWDRF